MVKQVGEWVDEKRGGIESEKGREKRGSGWERSRTTRIRAIMEPQRQASWGGGGRFDSRARPWASKKKKGKAA